NALLVPPSDVTALQEALTRLQADPSLRARLGTQAHVDALAHYTWGARAARILEFVAARG
ncbi:MAG: glycosyltransferase, partial [Chloroflexota bacterium]